MLPVHHLGTSPPPVSLHQHRKATNIFSDRRHSLDDVAEPYTSHHFFVVQAIKDGIFLAILCDLFGMVKCSTAIPCAVSGKQRRVQYDLRW